MLKPLTLSLSLAVALGLCSMSKAGLHDNNCTTCGLASPQGVVASPQGSYCGLRRAALRAEAPLQPSGLKNLFHHQVTYEWVLKKKHNWFNHGGGCNTCGGGAPRCMRPARAASLRRASMRPVGPVPGASGQYGARLRRRAASRSSRPARRPASPRCPPR